MQPGPQRTHSEPLPTRPNPSPEASPGESTPLLPGSPLPPPAYPDIMARDENSGVGPSDRYTDDGGPSKDLEDAGIVLPAVHLHHRPNRPWSRGMVIRLLLIACAHAILLWLILTVALGHRSKKHHVQQPYHDLPSSASPELPSYCHELHSQTSTYDFEELDDFHIVEQLEHQQEGLHDIHGTIKLVPADADQLSKIRTHITISNNFPEHDITISRTPNRLTVHNLPSTHSPVRAPRACTIVEIVVSVPLNTILTSLTLTSAHLSVSLHPLLSLSLTSTLAIDLSGGGSITAHAPLPARRTYLRPTHGSVTGTYPLLDVLDIRTATGSVDIAVEPHDADPTTPLPALFSARSASGSINARFPTDDADALPDRDYRVNIRTEAGSIQGSYVHGSETSFVAKQGGVTVAVLPWRVEKKSTLSARTEAGVAIVEVLAPVEDADGERPALKEVKGSFTSAVGAVRVLYPDVWEGAVELDTKVGAARVDGEGLVVVGEGTHGPVGKWVKAVKGEGGETCVVESGAGSVEFLVVK